jgi:hypothetical protein
VIAALRGAFARLRTIGSCRPHAVPAVAYGRGPRVDEKT